jgi:hypothetical protein
MATKREFLVEKGLAKAGRGKFSALAHAALEEAIASGVVFDEPVKPVKEVATEGDKPSQPMKPTSETAEVRAWASSNGIKVGERGRIPEAIVKAYHAGDVTAAKPRAVPTYAVAPQTRTRQVKCMYGQDEAGRVIGFGLCRRCSFHVSLCKCSGGPTPPSMVVKVLDRTDPL